MTRDDESTREAATDATSGASAWLSNRAGLIILLVIAAVVAIKLMASWLKWLLIALVVAATVYLVKGARRRMGDG